MTGMPVELLEEDSGHVVIATFYLDRTLKRVSLKLPEEHRYYRMQDMIAIFRDKEFTNLVPSLAHLSPRCLAVDFCTERDFRLCFQFQDSDVRDNFYSCLKILRMSLDAGEVLTRFSSFLRAEDQWRKDHGTAPMTVKIRIGQVDCTTEILRAFQLPGDEVPEGVKRLCTATFVIKGLRTKYCKVTKACVKEFDHFCGLIGSWWTCFDARGGYAADDGKGEPKRAAWNACDWSDGNAILTDRHQHAWTPPFKYMMQMDEDVDMKLHFHAKVPTMARRDEVWERKRQAFLARQNGDAASAVSRPSGLGAVSQARYQGREGRHSSPLSRLVHEGYPDVPPPETQGTDTRQYGMQAYAQGGSRPNSQSRQPLQQQPQQQEGFHSGVAQQWSNNVQRNIVVHQQQNDPNFTGPKKPQGYRVSQSPGGPSSINLSWNEAPNRAPSPARVAKPEAPVGGARGASPARMLEVVHPSRLPSGVAAVPQEAASPAGVGVRQPSPANGRYERYEGAAGLAGPPAQRHPCYGDPQVHAGGAAPRAMPSYDPQAAGLAHPPAGRHPCYGDPQVNLAQPSGPSGPSTQQARPLYDPQAPAAGAKAPAPAQRHPCYGDPQAAALPPRRTPSPCNGRAKEVPMAAAGFQAHQMHRGGAPYAYDGGPAAGLPPPLPREARAQDQPLGREQPRVSSNAYACGGNQNCGNVITDRRSTRVAQPPGGSSSICFGGWAQPSDKAIELSGGDRGVLGEAKASLESGNHRLFMALVVVEVTVQLIHLAMCFAFLQNSVTGETYSAYAYNMATQYPMVVFVVMMHSFSSPGIAFLLVNHLYLAAVNLTTNEMINAYRYDHFWQVIDGRK
ncbi:Ankyrin repeat domain-containing protein 50, partial [Durusdinium trenchii]